jgi:hypothetical protein
VNLETLTTITLDWVEFKAIMCHHLEHVMRRPELARHLDDNCFEVDTNKNGMSILIDGSITEELNEPEA